MVSRRSARRIRIAGLGSVAASALAAALLVQDPAPVSAAPPFFGATYAYVQGPDDPANLAGGRPVHVAALLPGRLACTALLGAQLDDPPPYPRVTNSLRAARVNVVLEKSGCPEPGKDNWVRFTVPHPVQADILNLVFQSPGGTFLGNQKVSIAPGGGGPFHD